MHWKQCNLRTRRFYFRHSIYVPPTTSPSHLVAKLLDPVSVRTVSDEISKWPVLWNRHSRHLPISYKLWNSPTVSHTHIYVLLCRPIQTQLRKKRAKCPSAMTIPKRNFLILLNNFVLLSIIYTDYCHLNPKCFCIQTSGTRRIFKYKLRASYVWTLCCCPSFSNEIPSRRPVVYGVRFERKKTSNRLARIHTRVLVKRSIGS